MTDILQQTITLATHYEAELMTWVPTIVLFIIALLFGYSALRNWLKEQFLYRRVRKLGVAALRNIVIPDGMDGRVLIDNVILAPDGIYVLPIKRYCGIIFAADNIDSWTQVIGKHSYKFTNPLRELETYIMALRNLLPAVKVVGYILVTRDAEFPKGKPERVLPIELAADLLGITKAEIPVQLKEAWDDLKAAGLELNIEEKRTMKHFDDGNGYASQHIISLGLFCAALGWLAWRLWGSVGS